MQFFFAKQSLNCSSILISTETVDWLVLDKSVDDNENNTSRQNKSVYRVQTVGEINSKLAFPSMKTLKTQ